jgi:phosphotransferase system enzyme I (PtsI)
VTAKLKGESVANGIALGKVHLRGYEGAEGFTPRIPNDQIEVEIGRLRDAFGRAREQLEALKHKHGSSLGADELRIFDTHIAYLDDPKFAGEIERLVREEQFSLRAAIRKVVADYERIFQLVENEYLRQRAGDFRDVATRVLRNLEERAVPEPLASAPGEAYVLAARQLTTVDMFSLDDELVAGIVAEEGGISSHAAILARSMGIPTVTGIRDLPGKLVDGDFIVVDGSSGEVVVNPDPAARADYERAAARHREAARTPLADEERAVLRDGTEIRIHAACGNLGEVDLARTLGMDGVGLYRTELMFLLERKVPDEADLVEHYREVVRQPGAGPVHFRLLDVGTTTPVVGLNQIAERNPALGMRGVRALLDTPALLRLQIRAILRAAAGTHRAALLVPFVTGSADLARTRAVVVEERLALRKRKEPCADSLGLAPILEVPAAALNLRTLFEDADFAVVALDDLHAHLLAADRDNPRVRDYYQMMHPALFELLARMARDAQEADKRLILFGESAADPLRLPFYLGAGYTDFSVAPVRRRGMLRVLRRYTLEECQQLAAAVLEAPRTIDVQKILVAEAES